MKIALLGDIALYGKYSKNNKNLFNYLEEIKEYLSQFDYVIGNLETPFSKEEKPIKGKSATIRSYPENIEILKYLKINIVNLANNHMFDYGEIAFNKTIKTLEENGIDYFGVNNKPLLLNNAIALHGYCSYNTNPSGVSLQDNNSVTALNIKEISKNILKNHNDNFLNIISIHSGQEHVNYPSIDDIEMAHLFADICPYIYYGHHPHVVQGIEEFKSSIIAYSLGNFLFDDVYTEKSSKPLVKQNDNNKTGLILEIELDKNKIISHNKKIIYSNIEKLEIIHDTTTNYYRQLDNHTNALINATSNKVLYNTNRDTIISNYINDRKTQRDINWYIKRLNLNSVRIIINSKINAIKYKNNVTKYLQ
ncbi:CapA family protein [Thiothrix winogradskyi]|uniref:CapA family protein n=1 Tax=Thiothrix winogradskyi TaxID=96472 RepID=A0ABY3T0M2_9GAMM|nr:CapA family protein [Thiothrix winogradskyi]UJS24296.1 CapA family protein [Thiothrix winogradskyi]